MDFLFNSGNVIILASILTVVASTFSFVQYLNGKRSSENMVERHEIDAELAAMHLMLMKLTANQGGVDDADRINLIKDLKESIKNEAADELIKDIQNLVEKNSALSSRLNLVNDQKDRTLKRLNYELDSLTRRGNLNLAIGASIAMLGVAMLGFFTIPNNLFYSLLGISDLAGAAGPPAGFSVTGGFNDSENFSNFVMSYIPRLSLVILIEVFAYFFLLLYKTTLSEIKYFQNEITSVESKYLALVLAVQLDDQTYLNKSVDKFFEIERNFILKKGQTTIDFERDKLFHKDKSDLMSIISELIRRK